MNRTIIITLVTVFACMACNQTKNDDSNLNLSFEQQNDGFPVNWYRFGTTGFDIYLDSTTVKNGKYSAVIEYTADKEANYCAFALDLPENYNGKEITLSGYVKTENVSGGYAGLWMRIDPGIAFDNMHTRGITGTTDWTKYEVTLPMNPARTTKIVVGGLLVGEGKMWLNDLSVTIDEKDISKATPYVKPVTQAEKDNEFDNGSGIVFPPLDEQLINNLDLLGRLWGFLKYHHPEVGKGQYNWDYELFRILPAYLQTRINEDRDKLLLTWINKYGEIPTCEECKETAEDAYLKPDLDWIEKSDMTAGLKNKIHEIYRNRHQGEHFYIELKRDRNPEFLNENSYSNMSYPDAGFRLLSLYRYWNMIRYFFPYTYQTDKDWNTVLKEYIPLFLQAKDRLEYELAALRVIAEIHDTHANLWEGNHSIEQIRGKRYPPFRAEFIEDKLVVTDYYNPGYKDISELRVGDIITHINGRPVESIVDSLKPYYPASNQPVRLRDISRDILRADSTVDITYLTSGKQKQKELDLYKKDILKMSSWKKVNENEKCYKFIDDNIGYITLGNIKQEDVPNIKELFKNTKGIVIDIRNYPSSFVVFTLGSYFVSGDTPFVKFTKGNVNNPGEFIFTTPLQITNIMEPSPPLFIESNTGETYQGKVVVLVNEQTQSSAEYTAMAFRAGINTTIIGSTTAGADGNVSRISLPGGLSTMISGIGVYYPDGTPTQRIGIVPDIEVRPTIQGIKTGRDELLEKAIEIINK